MQAHFGGSPFEGGMDFLFTHKQYDVHNEASPSAWCYVIDVNNQDYASGRFFQHHVGKMVLPLQRFYIKCLSPVCVAPGTPGVTVYKVIPGPTPTVLCVRSY